MSEIKNTILHPENQPDIHLYPKTSADQVEGLQEFVEQYSSDSIKVPINVPKGASNGNITDEQLTILQKSNLNYIEMVNDKELYYLNDNGHTDGYLTYSHVGIENSKATIKTLTITVSAKNFVIVTTVVPTDAGGGKYYAHRLVFSGSAGSPTKSILTCLLIDTRATAYTNVGDLSLSTTYNKLIPISYNSADSGTLRYRLLTQIGWNPAASTLAVNFVDGYDTYSEKSFPLYGIEITKDTVVEL